MATARLTTDLHGRLTDESTITVDGRTYPVPARVDSLAGRLAPARIVQALRDAGWKPATNYYNDLDKHAADGYTDIAVEPI